MSTTSDQSANASPRPGDTYVQSFARGLAVIRAFGPGERREQTLSEVAKHVGMTRAAARRAILTLQQLGYVAQNNRRRFHLTEKVLELAAAFITPMHQAAHGAVSAWDATVLPVANDGLMQERMEVLRDAVESLEP